ncbi:hypothetical protein OESDEN_18707 [Oesophagostomum dentatum]|uniref:DDE Tnp4 domain-containing protein n=1 Tax=Oesophagostomum dentatum TaxID=61180 RepID=A0A0B1SEI5_OESDE|nr:hypothetical protein OESDEN_18707 [Oesophagostomum dentatum]
MTEEFLSLAVTLRKAHLLVEDAITELKSQFPLLCAKIKSTRIARIVVSCAALYNLTRSEGEPPFPESEQDPFKKDATVIDTVVIN